MPSKRKPAGIQKKSSTMKKKSSTTKKKASQSKKTKASPELAPSKGGDMAEQIEQHFNDIGGWRGETLARMRALIRGADPELVEERKWIKPSNPFGVPTYSRHGLVLTLEVYKEYVKVTFAVGSRVPDPTGIFNASLLGLRRAIDIREGESVNLAAFQALVRAAVAVNAAKRGG